MAQIQRAASAALRSAVFKLAQHQESPSLICKPFASYTAIEALHATCSTSQECSVSAPSAHPASACRSLPPAQSLLSLGGTSLLSQQQLRCMSSSGTSSSNAGSSTATGSSVISGTDTSGGGKGAAADAASSLLGGLKLQAPSNPFARRPPRPSVPKLVLYRGRGMLLWRFLVRAKVFQFMGILAAAVFASVVLTTSNPNPMDLAAVGALAAGCVVTSYCIWYYSGRYVGEMSLLLPERRVVRFSVLDFWGNREDNDVPLERLVPPWRQRSVAEVRGQARQALMPVSVQGDREYYISVPHGHVLQKELLQKLLYGAPLEGEAAVTGGSGGEGMASSASGSSSGESGTGSSGGVGGELAGAPVGGQGAQADAGVAAADGAGAVPGSGKAASTEPAASKGRAA